MEAENMYGHSDEFILKYHVTGKNENYSKVPQNIQIFLSSVVVSIATYFNFNIYYFVAKINNRLFFFNFKSTFELIKKKCYI